MHTNRRTSASALPSLPPGAQRSAVNPTSGAQHAFPSSDSGYTFQITPPASNKQTPLLNPWDTAPQRHNDPPIPPPKPPRPRIQSMQHPPPSRLNGSGSGVSASPGYAGSSLDLGGVQRYPFPEPTFYRTTSFRNEQPNVPPPPPPRPSPGLAPGPGRLTHHRSTSDLGTSSGAGSTPTLRVPQMHQNPSVLSFASSYNGHSDDDQGYHEVSPWLQTRVEFHCSLYFIADIQWWSWQVAPWTIWCAVSIFYVPVSHARVHFSMQVC